MRSWVIGIKIFPVPTSRKSDLSNQAFFTRCEAFRKAGRLNTRIIISETNPLDTSRILSVVRALERITSHHLEPFRKLCDVSSYVPIIAKLVVDFEEFVRDAVEASVVAVPEKSWAPVETLVRLDAGGRTE